MLPKWAELQLSTILTLGKLWMQLSKLFLISQNEVRLRSLVQRQKDQKKDQKFDIFF
jgi:hypothetical protein